MEKSISSSWINFYNENILKGFQNLSENSFTLFTSSSRSNYGTLR